MWRRRTATKRPQISKTPNSIVLNTCHIRERASEKIYSELGKFRELKEARESAGLKTTIVVPAVSPKPKAPKSVRRQPAVDLVVGPQNYHRLPQLLRRGAICDRDRRYGVSRLKTNSTICPPPTPGAIRSRGVSAFVTVQEGCDKFCSFCVVPYTRGAESSRPVAKVMEEISPRLARAGVREADADRPERQRLSRRWTRPDGTFDLADLAERGRGYPRHPARPLYDLASQRHERGADSRASRQSVACAVSCICPFNPARTGFWRR